VSLGQRRPPRILYHYTDAQGLLSMLQSRSIWATDAAFMNDPGELRYGYMLLDKIVRDRLAGRRARLVLDIVQSVLDEKVRNARVYVASFCERDDLLSQWRGYGGLGGGFAVGFIAKYLRPAGAWSDSRQLRPVLYKPKVQTRILSVYADKWKKERGENVASRNRILADVLYLFSDHLMAFKDPSYSEEREWRLIQYGRIVGGEILFPASFRVRGAGIVPYASLDLSTNAGALANKLPVADVVCGPAAHRERTAKAIVQLADSLGYDCEVLDQPGERQRNATRPRLVVRFSRTPFVT
jgi:hypothetical protein